MQFSKRHNAVYGIDDMMMFLISMCRFNTTASSASEELATERENKDMHTPTAQWVLKKLKDTSHDAVMSTCTKMLNGTIRHARRIGIIQSGIAITLALDMHLISRYDKIFDKFHMVRSRGKNGTTRFEGYITAQQCAGNDCGADLHLGCLPLSKGARTADFVRKMLQIFKRNGLQIGLLLVDRGFYSAEMISMLQNKGIKFLMPAVKNSGVKKAIREYDEGKRRQVSEYVLKSRNVRTGNGSAVSAAFTLVIIKKDDKDCEESDRVEDRYVVFATNIKQQKISGEIAALPSEYKKRWVIETGYRMVEQHRAVTASRNPALRIMLFYISLVVANMWIITNYLVRNHAKYANAIITFAICLKYFMQYALDLLRAGPGPPRRL